MCRYQFFLFRFLIGGEWSPPPLRAYLMTYIQTLSFYIGSGWNMCSLIWLTCRPSGVPIENQRGQGGGLRLFWNQVIKNTIFVGTIVPTNLSEQPIGIQFPVPTILVETVLFPQSLWEHQGVYILQKCRGGGGGNNICTLSQIWGRILVLWLFSQNFTYFSRFWLQSDLKMQ